MEFIQHYGVMDSNDRHKRENHTRKQEVSHGVKDDVLDVQGLGTGPLLIKELAQLCDVDEFEFKKFSLKGEGSCRLIDYVRDKGFH